MNTMVRLPAAIRVAIILYAQRNKVSVSAYLRQLVTDDLVKQGYLSL